MSSSANVPTLGAVVLAGGMARRMGGNDKGLVLLNGKPMVSWVLQSVQSVADVVVVNANRNADDYAAFGAEVIADVVADFAGPLAGLLSACEHLNTDWVLMCPCDTPFIKPEMLSHLWSAVAEVDTTDTDTDTDTDTGVVVAHDGDRLQPVFAIVRRDLKSSLHGYLADGNRKIDLWYESVGFKPVDCSKYRSMFDNINTPEQRDAAQLRLQV